MNSLSQTYARYLNNISYTSSAPLTYEQLVIVYKVLTRYPNTLPFKYDEDLIGFGSYVDNLYLSITRIWPEIHSKWVTLQLDEIINE